MFIDMSERHIDIYKSFEIRQDFEQEKGFLHPAVFLVSLYGPKTNCSGRFYIVWAEKCLNFFHSGKMYTWSAAG